MNTVLALLTHPISLSRLQQFLLLLPLCLTVSVVYKTTRCPTLREIPLAAAVSWITIVIAMYAVGVAVMLLYRCLV